MKNLSKCHSVLVLSACSEDENASETGRLINFFKQQGKEVFALCFKGKKVNDFNIQVTEIKMFGPDHLNRIFIPNDPYIQDVMSREFDLLVDLTLADYFPIKYIHALSNSKLKVGASMNYKIAFSDLTINIDGNPKITYLITQVKHYLTQINQDQYVGQL